MPQGNKIEEYKLSDEQIAFADQFKKFKRIQDFLGAEATRLNQEMQQVSGLMLLLNEAASELEVPENILRGFADQEFGEVEEAVNPGTTTSYGV